MRLCRSSLASGGSAVTAALAATAVMFTPAITLTLTSAAPAAAAAAATNESSATNDGSVTNDSSAALQPTCAGANGGDFPIDTRIHGGPGTYEAGGGRQEWLIDLTNTTGEACGNIHPVVVLVDDRRSLQPRQVRLEFEDSTRMRAVTFEHTDEDENVGVFGDDFGGFTVAPGATVTVKVRLSFTGDAQPGHVVANAAIVQRRGDDGDWVGESNNYAFTVEPIAATPSPSTSPVPSTEPEPSPGTATPDSSPSAREPKGKEADDELAGTGRRRRALTGIAVTAGALLLGGATLVLAVRRVRLRRR